MDDFLPFDAKFFVTRKSGEAQDSNLCSVMRNQRIGPLALSAHRQLTTDN
jgi:hypothetical protein